MNIYLKQTATITTNINQKLKEKKMKNSHEPRDVKLSVLSLKYNPLLRNNARNQS